MSWDWGEIAGTEPAQIVGTEDALEVGVLEGDPRETAGKPGQTSQRVQLLIPDARRLDPPMRLMVRGVEVRVLGSKMPPWPGEPSITICERVNPDFPDELVLYRVTEAFDPETNRTEQAETEVWTGSGHVASGDPRLVETAEERAPLDRVVITCNTGLTGVELDDLWARVTHSVNPAVTGVYKLTGESLDSSSRQRRFVAERKGWL